MRFEDFTFGSIRIDGVTYEHDVVIDRGQVRKRKKKPSKKFRAEFGHTPAVSCRKDTVEMSTPRGGHGHRRVTRDGGTEARSQTTQH